MKLKGQLLISTWELPRKFIHSVANEGVTTVFLKVNGWARLTWLMILSKARDLTAFGAETRKIHISENRTDCFKPESLMVPLKVWNSPINIPGSQAIVEICFWVCMKKRFPN